MYRYSLMMHGLGIFPPFAAARRKGKSAVYEVAEGQGHGPLPSLVIAAAMTQLSTQLEVNPIRHILLI